jgi:hypothetical protein
MDREYYINMITQDPKVQEQLRQILSAVIGYSTKADSTALDLYKEHFKNIKELIIQVYNILYCNIYNTFTYYQNSSDLDQTTYKKICDYYYNQIRCEFDALFQSFNQYNITLSIIVSRVEFFCIVRNFEITYIIDFDYLNLD